ncbi:MAG TPA: DNA-protecting protein DprA [Firmicutes bacterium]|nr:DNA-protecting protein DprA [Bacillota bacterium]
MLQEENKYYHALKLVPSLGPRRIKRLIDYFKTPQEAWKAPKEDLLRLDKFGVRLVDEFLRRRSMIDPDRAWEGILKKNIKVISWDEPGYPHLLKEIYDPPPLLYYQGDIGVLRDSCLAIVGSRRHTAYGKEIAYKFAAKLADYGLTIVSGMARGIDTWAHRGSLEGGGRTAAVLGSGVDVCYPAENRDLKERISGNGIVISEFPPGTKPLPNHFPQRNRIISGLSLGTLVIEATSRSGSLITADFALEQGREVFAVPGGVGSPFSKGCHKLLKEGAKLAESVEDILEELLIPLRHGIELQETEQSSGGGHGGDGGLLDLIPYQPVLMEEIILQSNKNAAEVAVLLLELELSGKIKQLPGKYYMRI